MITNRFLSYQSKVSSFASVVIRFFKKEEFLTRTMSLDVNLGEPDEFNCQELHTSLNEIAKLKGVKNYEYHVDFVCGKGEHFIANVFRTKLINSDNVDNTFTVIVKTLINTERKELFHELHKREVSVYKDVIPKYVKFQEVLKVEDRVLFPECLHSVVEKSKEVIILEDMKEKQYYTDNTLRNKQNLDYTQATLVLKELAKLHSLSIIYEKYEQETFAKLKTEFRDIIFEKSFLNKTKLRHYFYESFGTSLDLVENFEAKSKLERIGTKLLEILRLFTEPRELGRCAVLCHGDFWLNNIMFKYEENFPTKLCFIDFQTMRYSSPVTDILHFIYLCTDSTFRKQHFEQLLTIYHDNLKWFLNLHDIDVNLVYSREEFDQDIEELKPFGLLVALLELRLVTSPEEDRHIVNEDEEIKLGEVIEERDKISEYYKLRVNDVVKESLENGVIDKLIKKIDNL